MAELIKCRGRSCDNCGKLIIEYAYLVPKVIRVKNPKYKRAYMKQNDEVTFVANGLIKLPEEVTYSKTKIIERVICKNCYEKL